jgi:hypothetical protein
VTLEYSSDQQAGPEACTGEVSSDLQTVRCVTTQGILIQLGRQ